MFGFFFNEKQTPFTLRKIFIQESSADPHEKNSYNTTGKKYKSVLTSKLKS